MNAKYKLLTQLLNMHVVIKRLKNDVKNIISAPSHNQKIEMHNAVT